MSDWQPSLLLHWYDRNPRSVSYAKGWEVGPHTATLRHTYTCPEKKVAMIELLQCSTMRYTAAGTPSAVNAYWYFKAKGESETAILIIAEFLENDVGSKVNQAIGTTITMFAGDKLFGKTADASIGGTVIHRLGYKITEFDDEPPKNYVYVVDPTPKPDIQQPEAVKDPPM